MPPMQRIEIGATLAHKPEDASQWHQRFPELVRPTVAHADIRATEKCVTRFAHDVGHMQIERLPRMHLDTNGAATKRGGIHSRLSMGEAVAFLYFTIRTAYADRRRQRNFITWRGPEHHAKRKAQQAHGQRPQSEFLKMAATDGGGRASRVAGLGGDDVLSGVHVSGRVPCPLCVLMRLDDEWPLGCRFARLHAIFLLLQEQADPVHSKTHDLRRNSYFAICFTMRVLRQAETVLGLIHSGTNGDSQTFCVQS